MTQWEFWETQRDGEAWLADPSERHAVVVYTIATASSRSARRRITVVTQAWLVRETQKLGPYPLAASLALPPMIVLRDAAGEELRDQLNRTLADGGKLLDSISTALEA